MCLKPSLGSLEEAGLISAARSSFRWGASELGQSGGGAKVAGRGAAGHHRSPPCLPLPPTRRIGLVNLAEWSI